MPAPYARKASSEEWFSFQGGRSGSGTGPPSGEKDAGSAARQNRTGLGKRKSGGGKAAAPADDLATAVGGLTLEGGPSSSYPTDRTFVGPRSSSRDRAPSVDAPEGYDGKGILGEGPGDPSVRRASEGKALAPSFEMGGLLNGSLEDGLMVAFKAKDKGQYWVATERRGWALELAPAGVESSDPAAQFLVVMRGKVSAHKKSSKAVR
jgi:hypothetical protein